MNTESLGIIIKKRRKAKGWTIRQLSIESGISASHIARIEHGECFPSAHILSKLAPLYSSEENWQFVARRKDMTGERSLYCCFNAKVEGDKIRCSKNHPLKMGAEKEGISIKRLIRGCPLVYAICQNCEDYLEMGPPVSKEDRGWLQNIH